MSSLKIENLFLKFGNEKTLFEDFTLYFPEEQIIGIVGKNGIGKTVLAKFLIGAIKTNAGFVFFNKKLISNLKLSKRSKIINFSHFRKRFSFFKNSVLEEIIYTLKNNNYKGNNSDIEKTVRTLLNKYHLATKSDTNPIFLSGGEQRLLSYLLIEIIDPQVLIFDEPTVGLDNNEKIFLINLIKEYKQKLKKILVITHNVDFLSRITNKFIVLSQKSIKDTSHISYIGRIFDFYYFEFHKMFPELQELEIIKFYKFVEQSYNLTLKKNVIEEFQKYEIFPITE